MATDYSNLVSNQIQEKLQTINPKYISLGIWSLVSIFSSLVIYTCFVVYRNKQELQVKKHILKLTFSGKYLEKSDVNQEFYNLLTKLHILAKGSIITFEIHQNQNKMQIDSTFTSSSCFVITTTRLDLLESIKQELELIKGVVCVENVADPLLLIYENGGLDTKIETKSEVKPNSKIKPKYKPYILKLSASSSYGNFKADVSVLPKNIIQYLKLLEPSQFGAIIVAFRPTYTQSKIRSKIASLNFKAMRNGKTYGLDHNLVKEVKELETKNQSPIFSVKISIIGSSTSVVDNLAACFNLISNQNYLVSKTSNDSLSKLRYTKAEDFFMSLNRSNYGSYFNCNELASIVQLTHFGADITIKNTISDSGQFIEKTMTSFKNI